MTVSVLRKNKKVHYTAPDGTKKTCEVYEVIPAAIMTAAGDVDSKTDAELINGIFPQCCSLTIAEIEELPNPADVVAIFEGFKEVNKHFLMGVGLKVQISGKKEQFNTIFKLLSRWDKAFSSLVSGYVQEVSTPRNT